MLKIFVSDQRRRSSNSNLRNNQDMQKMNTAYKTSSPSSRSSESHDPLFNPTRQQSRNATKTSSSREIFNKSNNQCYTTINQIDEYSYVISFDSSFLTHHHNGQSLLSNIYSDLINSEESLLKTDTSIHVKEYTIDSYECRCEEHQ